MVGWGGGGDPRGKGRGWLTDPRGGGGADLLILGRGAGVVNLAGRTWGVDLRAIALQKG